MSTQTSLEKNVEERRVHGSADDTKLCTILKIAKK